MGHPSRLSHPSVFEDGHFVTAWALQGRTSAAWVLRAYAGGRHAHRLAARERGMRVDGQTALDRQTAVLIRPDISGLIYSYQPDKSVSA